MSDLNADPIAEAAKLGLVVVTPQPDELFLDIDNAADAEIVEQVWAVFGRNGFDIRFIKETESKSGNTHLYLRAPRALTDLERIALQACLGSDRTREALSFLRTFGERTPTLFFEKPEAIA
jgi:hypothetical protein